MGYERRALGLNAIRASADNIDPSVLDHVFMRITAEIEGKPVNVALRIDPDNWTKDYPYGWKVIDILAEGQ